jgi:hypothetical protein
MNTHLIALVAMLALAIGLPTRSDASTTAATYAYGNSNISPPSPLGDSENLSSPGNSLNSESSKSGMTDYWSLSAFSSALVQPGQIQLFASSTALAIDDGPPSYVTSVAQASANASWYDTFTINAGVLDGEIGHLVVGFGVGGTLTSSFDESVRLGASVDVGYRTQLRLTNGSGSGQDVIENGGKRHLVDWQGARWERYGGYPLRDPGLWIISLDIKFGTPIQVSMWGDLYAYGTAFACDSGSCTYPESAISATADFGHTMYWGGFLSLTDAQGHGVTAYSVTSDSGFEYRVSAVPLLPTHALLLSGLGLIGFVARRVVG